MSAYEYFIQEQENVLNFEYVCVCECVKLWREF